MSLQHRTILFALCATLTAGCGGIKKVEGEEAALLNDAVDTATSYLLQSKRFTELRSARLDTSAQQVDRFQVGENKLQYVSETIVAELDGEKATVSLPVASQTENGEVKLTAFVFLHRDSGTWRGTNTIILD